jgi:tripartite-type tricarboxylate transporter receptor subunit TctC
LILVPYGGASPSIVATAGGHADVTFGSPAEVLTQVKAGNLKVLAVLGEKRSPLLPRVPTLLEKGIDLTAGSWRGIVAPLGTPRDRIQLLNQAFKKALESEFIEAFCRKTGMTSDYLGPEDFRRFMEEEDERYREFLAETD